MLFVLFIGFLLFAGHVLSEWLWSRESALCGGAVVLGPAERIASSLGLTLLLWVAVNWALSFFRAIDAASLFLVSMVLAGAAWFLYRSLPSEWDRNPFRPGNAASGPIHSAYRRLNPALAAVAGMVFALWVGFVIWRGTLIPVGTHDALAYHFPKAVLIARHHGYAFFPSNDPRLSCQPPNFELLLSNFFIFNGTDWLTTGLSTGLYITFVALAMALMERWWNEALPALATGILVAGLPVILLHSGGQKNDLMMGVMLLAAAIWVSRWVAQGGRAPLLLGVLFLMAGCGTKPQGGLFVVGALPFVVWGLCRRRRGDPLPFRTALLLGFGAAIAGFVLLGGASYLIHAAGSGTILGYRLDKVVDTVHESTNYYSPNYGEWANFYLYPYLLLTIPFSSSPLGVWLPWRHEYWFWPKYEIYMSHYGLAFTILVVAIPFAVLLLRRHPLEPGRSLERLAGTLLLVVEIILFLPIRYKILGAFNAFPRYLLFIPVLVAGWSLAPALGLLQRQGGRNEARAAAGITLALIGVFFVQGLDMANHDRFQPLNYVMALSERPDLGRVIYFKKNRAASIVDSLAGPNDAVAVDSAIDGWIYPAYGRYFTRPVQILVGAGPGSMIDPAVKWVAIDRCFGMVWEHPDFTNMGQFWKYVWKGRLGPEDLVVYGRLKKDPGFRLVYEDPAQGQFVFQRVSKESGS